jgi:Ca2+-binding RTX toxin-like protein
MNHRDRGGHSWPVPAAGVDLVQSTALRYTLSANVENLVFTGTGNFSGTGNALANNLRGGARNDTLDGGLGNEVFVFNAPGYGADTILGFDANPVGGHDLLDLTGLGGDHVLGARPHH